MIDNYIDIHRQERSQSIYRIVSISRLLEMLDLKINTLLKPKLWDDPFENFICASTFKPKNGKPFRFPHRDRAYGQCWTLEAESDAMWRIYAPNKDGAKIETSISTLYDSLRNARQNRYPGMSCFIGKVKYDSQGEFEELINDPDRVCELMNGEKRHSRGQAKTLLLKRIEFKHEKEIRLLYLDPHNKGFTDTYQYPCDPFKLIKSITLDPRMDPRIYEVYRTYLNKLGYKGKIDQSKLYSIPQLIVAYKFPDFK